MPITGFHRNKGTKDGHIAICKKCRKEYDSKHSVENSTRVKEYYKKYPNKRRSYHKKYYKREKLYINQKSRNRYANFYQQAFNALGDKCIKCGFTDKRALQIDHIDGGGSIERRKNRGSYQYYKNMVNNITNKKVKYQILCANCNLIESIKMGFRKSIWA